MQIFRSFSLKSMSSFTIDKNSIWNKMQQILVGKSEEMINWVVLKRNIHGLSIPRILYMRLHWENRFICNSQFIFEAHVLLKLARVQWRNLLKLTIGRKYFSIFFHISKVELLVHSKKVNFSKHFCTKVFWTLTSILTKRGSRESL